MPVTPPVAPVAAMREAASACVTHAMLVPAELTSGSAAHVRPPPHCDWTNLPPTHCTNASPMHAF